MGSGIEVFYAVCAASGFIFALFAAISGHHGHGGGHHGHFGHGHGGGHHGHFFSRAGHRGGGGARGARGARGAHATSQQGQAQMDQTALQTSDMESVSFVSPLTLAMFVGSLGFLGLIFRGGMALSPEMSIMLAAPSALLVTVMLFYVFVKVFVSSESTSLTRVQDCVGVEAEVVSKIEPGRVGSIAYVDKGARITLPARSEGNDAFNRGDRVYISRFEGNTAYVQSSRGSLWDA